MENDSGFRRRREDKLEEDERREKPPIPGYEETDDLPLRTKPLKVARINRKVLGIILGGVALITLGSLIYSFSPHRGGEARKAKEEAGRVGTASTPTLPEAVTGLPGSYGTRKNLPPGVPRLPTISTVRKPNANPSAAFAVRPSFEAEAGRRAPGVTVPPPLPLPPPAAPLAGYPLEAKGQSPRDKEIFDARKSPVEFPTPNVEAQKAAASVPSLVPPAVLPALVSAGPKETAEGTSPRVPQQPVDDQNLQTEKREFVREKHDDPYVKASLLKPVSPYEIKAGTIFPATLLTGINSDLPGQITAQISESIYDTVTGRYLLIPQGTRIVGEYDSKVAYGQERVLVVWSRLILPNGYSISLEGMPGVDLSGYSGLKDRVNNHYWKLISGVVLGSVIGAGAQVATGGQGAPNVPPSFGQLAVSGAAQNLNQAGQTMTQKNLNLQPTIEIRPGMQVNVFATKDLIMEPYK